MRSSELNVQHRTADVNGIRMHYATKGEGPLVVLLHGFPENWWSWRHQIDPLVEAGFRVVVPDQRGYNDTEARGPYDLDTLAHDVVALIDHLGEKDATLIAHDWGGAVAWHFAGRHAERLRRLVVLNCPHPELMRTALLRKPSQLRRSGYMFFFQLPWIPEWVLTRDRASAMRRIFRAHARDRTNFGDDEIEPFRTGILKTGRASGMLAWYRSAIRRGLLPLRPQTQTHHGAFDTPTLLIWAMQDVALGYDDLVPGTERFARNLTVRSIERCGHFVQSERPDEVNQLVLEFLEE